MMGVYFGSLQYAIILKTDNRDTNFPGKPGIMFFIFQAISKAEASTGGVG